MYKVIVVDDEPTALNHVCMILQKKCPEYEIIGRAGHGAEALELIEKFRPDVLISDVRMPVMDGITLVSQVKEQYPEILSVIVSGYSEFEYAKSALTAGVCDYLLKPLAPADMEQMMQDLTRQLDTLYYQKRNQVMKALCKGQHVEAEQLQRVFSGGRYYSAIIRKNGLPKRFNVISSVELFPLEEERIYFYGRDELEALYLFSEELFQKDDFEMIIRKIVDNTSDNHSYITAVIHPQSFVLEEFTEVAKKLYQSLNRAIVIGENQLHYGDVTYLKKQKDMIEKELLEKLEYVIRYKEYGKVSEALQRIFEFWEHQKYSQLHVESRVKYLFQLLMNIWIPAQDAVEVEYLVDDAFYYATTMEELKESILNIIKLCTPFLEQDSYDDKEQLFQSILSYVNGHLAKTLTISSICREFGVSQTALSKMFRTYEDTSFSNYLTRIRITKAQDFMKKNPHTYVKNIAERVGYQDQFYFSRIFRSVTGMSPREYMDTIQ